jgi:calpain-15
MGNCQNVFQIENEIDFNSTIIKDKLACQNLNKSIIIEYKYSKYHHPIPIMKSSDIKTPHKYYKNKSPPSSFQNNEKFTDEIFPPNLHSLTYISDYNKEYVETSEITDFNNITWKRIGEIFKNNKFDLFNTLDVDDIRQGIIGNCYFLCVLSSFAKRPEIYDKIFIDKKINDNGLYRLRFIINGIPQIILVDDYFPTVNNKFIFAQSTNEFWVQLLEKAWAKINLSYANTIAGVPYEVFNCLSEAPCENISHQRHDKYYVWNELIRAKKHGFYITCNTKYLSKEQEEMAKRLIKN